MLDDCIKEVLVVKWNAGDSWVTGMPILALVKFKDGRLEEVAGNKGFEREDFLGKVVWIDDQYWFILNNSQIVQLSGQVTTDGILYATKNADVLKHFPDAETLLSYLEL